MSKVDLEELERLEKAAIPAPWDSKGPNNFIATMRNALPALMECARLAERIVNADTGDLNWSYAVQAREALNKLRGSDEG